MSAGSNIVKTVQEIVADACSKLSSKEKGRKWNEFGLPMATEGRTALPFHFFICPVLKT
jgi:hypothetical protein